MNSAVTGETSSAYTWSPSSINATGQSHVIGGDGGRLQILDEEQRIVMAFDREGGGSPPQHFHLTRVTRFDPEGRALGPRVPEDRPEHELGRAGTTVESACGGGVRDLRPDGPMIGVP